ncbi:hypothetical protein CWT12_12345 [Actinomyces sp. 432]|uniref:hypothetical protein n=1 Tax=Actinomyces sp. 432 TaxID=2057798 RepID=UPI001373B585|nr:hypothetical protein [Actinomyces sp. 432]QHO91942.1 hypothetical protein CWT12_12345 [Actinomyces sp. 432]
MTYDNPYSPIHPTPEIRPAVTLGSSARAHQAATLVARVTAPSLSVRERREAERELRDNAYHYITALLDLLAER